MAYFAPYFDSSGLHIPTFADIQDYLVVQAQSIFGSDIYLGNDSQDMQWISAVSMMVYDAMQMCVIACNNVAPTTAVGAGLSSVVKLNGLARLPATYSTCPVSMSGTAGTVIPAGVVADTAGYKWDLPLNSTIGSDGTLTVTVTCETPGAIVADIGTIKTIATPQYGWTSISNIVAATPGDNAETDAELRSRQAISVSVPSSTILDGIISAVLGVNGVTRAVGYQNDTAETDSDGIPPHSISIVADGGEDKAVADQIYARKTPGCGTYGTTTVNEVSIYNFTTPINFFRPAEIPVDVSISVKALNGYSGTLTANIQTNVVNYLNGLQIGADVIISSVFGAALQTLPNISSPAFSITAVTACKHGGTLAATDIVIAFNEAAQGLAANVTVTVI